MAKKLLTGADLNNQRLINLADPTMATDAVNLQYAQNLIRGFSWKQCVRAASTANTPLTAPGATMDGVTLVSGDRVLLKNQTNAAENGIHVWTGPAATLTRALDASTGPQLLGASVFVGEGTVAHDQQWTQNTDGTITIGTTNLTWAQFGGGNAYSAGSGLALSGSAFAVSPKASGGIIADGTGVSVDSAVVARRYSAAIGDGTSTALTVTHNLGTSDVIVGVRVASTGEAVQPDDIAATANTVTLTFATAPATSTYRATVIG